MSWAGAGATLEMIFFVADKRKTITWPKDTKTRITRLGPEKLDVVDGAAILDDDADDVITQFTRPGITIPGKSVR